jgi:hypothetical protein
MTICWQFVQVAESLPLRHVKERQSNSYQSFLFHPLFKTTVATTFVFHLIRDRHNSEIVSISGRRKDPFRYWISQQEALDKAGYPTPPRNIHATKYTNMLAPAN